MLQHNGNLSFEEGGIHMGLTKGTRIIKAAMQRESRLSKSKRITSPHGYNIMN